MSGDERESRERPSQPMEKEEMSGTLGGTQPGDEKMEDPLGLIRREIAVMKKLEYVLAIMNISKNRTEHHAVIPMYVVPSFLLTDIQLVHLYEAISVSTADALFLVLEYMPGGTLMKVKIGEDDSNAQPPFDREQTREYFRQLCLGLEYLHANEVVHRDVSISSVAFQQAYWIYNIIKDQTREYTPLCR